MRIDYRNRIVYLANTKVGSTSLETALLKYGRQIGRVDGQPSIKHIDFSGYLKIAHTFGTSDFETVCVVRHPLAKAMSWYRYRTRPALVGSPRYTGDMSFADFVASVPEREVDDRYFVYDTQSGQAVDRIFKYEDFPVFLDWLRGFYGDEFALPNQNRSPEVAIREGIEAARHRFAEAIAWYEALGTSHPSVPVPAREALLAQSG